MAAEPQHYGSVAARKWSTAHSCAQQQCVGSETLNAMMESIRSTGRRPPRTPQHELSKQTNVSYLLMMIVVIITDHNRFFFHFTYKFHPKMETFAF